MLEHSSNNSSQSNLFALSSESERSELKKSKKHTYSAFVRKVKQLLEAEGDDLDELYRKVEIIVTKYFNEHKIVEFGDMYNHILALKSNGKKMSKIVAILQKKLIHEPTSKSKNPTEGKKSDRFDDFQITSSTHKETKNGKQRLQPYSNKQSLMQQHDHIKQSTDRVTTSIKYHYAIKPKPKQPQQSPFSKSKQPIQEVSPSRYSPGKLNSSFEEYQSRNRQYEDKVRELMRQLKDIKETLQNQPSRVEEESFERVQIGRNIREELKIRLDESSIREESARNDDGVNDGYLIPAGIHDTKKNRMSQTKQSDSLSLNRESFNIQIKPEKSVEKEKSNVSSVQTIGQQPIPLEEDRVQRHKRQQLERSANEKKSILLQQANSITKQLQQLRQVATMLQIESSPKIETNQSILKAQDQVSVLSSDTKIYQLTRPDSKNNVTKPQSREEEVNQQEVRSSQPHRYRSSKKEILQKISNASSKIQPTEEMIPSFKNIQEAKQTQLQTSIMPGQPSMKRVDDSSIFSFSNTRLVPQLIESNHHTVIGSNQEHHSYNYSRQISSNSSNNAYQQAPVPLAVSTVRRGFNPYPQAEPPLKLHHPQIRFQQQRTNKSISINKNQSAVLSPKNSNQFTVTLSRSQMPVDKAQGIHIASSRQKGSTESRYSHLRQGQNQRSASRGNVRFVSPTFTYQNGSVSQNSSTTSMKRRGMNIISPGYPIY